MGLPVVWIDYSCLISATARLGRGGRRRRRRRRKRGFFMSLLALVALFESSQR